MYRKIHPLFVSIHYQVVPWNTSLSEIGTKLPVIIRLFPLKFGLIWALALFVPAVNEIETVAEMATP